MAPAVHAASGAHLQAVASRSPERSTVLDPLVVRADYDALLDDPDVDAVYVCLANDQHAEWVVKALDAGTHVLCEKPLGRDSDEARHMASAARRADRLLVEAVWTRWHPRFRRLAEIATSGALGDLSSIDSSFTFTGAIDGNYRADPSKGGGSLLTAPTLSPGRLSGHTTIESLVVISASSHGYLSVSCSREVMMSGSPARTASDIGEVSHSDRVANESRSV